MKKAEITPEPEKDAEGVTEIKFREPSSGKTFTRRFLKSETIQILYDFVQSKLDEVEFEDEENMEFELVQTMPMKVFNDSDKTLDEEGLYPRAML